MEREEPSMYVIAVHEINDPDAFWSRAGDPPAGLELPTVAPSEDGTRAICIWKADSVDSVKKAVEDAVGDVSNNEFFGVDEGNAQGLPG
jgi:hypothetical protein